MRLAVVSRTVILAVATVLLLLTATAPVGAQTPFGLYVGTVNNFGPGGNDTRIARVTPSTGAQHPITTGDDLIADGMALGPDGMLYVVDRDCCGGGGGLFRVNPADGTRELLSPGGNFTNPSGVAVTSDGQIYVADGPTATIIQVNPSTGAQTVLLSAADTTVILAGIAIGHDGHLYVANRLCCLGNVLRFNRFTREFAFITGVAPGDFPADIAIDANGDIFLAGFTCCGGDGGIIKVDPLTGAQTIVASGGHVQRPGSIDIGPDGDLYVGTGITGPGTGKVIRVNPATGAQTVVAEGNHLGSVRAIVAIPGLTIGDASVTEGNNGTTTATFGVTLAPWSPLDLVVPYATANGTASANSDFGAVNDTLRFSPGQTSTSVNIPVVGDRLAEPTETFSVNLTAAPGTDLFDGQGIGTIHDDDGTATLSIADATVTEGNVGSVVASFPVTLSPASGQVVTVQFSTANGTALTSAGDYASTNGLLAFQPGEITKTIPVTVNGDTADEPDEAFSVTLASPTGGAAIGRAQATGTIRDDDEPLACTPRPRVRTMPVVGGGAMQVRIEATPLNTQQNNLIAELRFGELRNANVVLNGQPIVSGQTYVAPANTVAVDFTVSRVTPTVASTVFLTVVDGCGAWTTFVGGGRDAGF